MQPLLKITILEQAGSHHSLKKKSQPQNKCKPNRMKDRNLGNSAIKREVKYSDL